MKVLKEALEVLIVNNKFIGRSQQEIEDDFKLMLKQGFIDVDDYSNAMELIYSEED